MEDSDQAKPKAAPKKQGKVQHDYHDRSNDTTTGDDSSVDDSSENNKKSSSASSSVDQPFPVKLHWMLNDTERDGLTRVVSWQPHGRCFVVHDIKLFKELVLVNYFRQTKHASFQRQLNLYGFKRISAGADKNGYYHEFFLRTMPALAYKIERFKVKGKGMRKAASPETEPNFYEMKFMPQNEHRAIPPASAASFAPEVAPRPPLAAAAAAPANNDNGAYDALRNRLAEAVAAHTFQQQLNELLALKSAATQQQRQQQQQALLGHAHAAAFVSTSSSSSSGNSFGANSASSQLSQLLALARQPAAPAPAPVPAPAPSNNTNNALMLAALQNALVNAPRMNNQENSNGGSVAGNFMWQR